MFLFFSSMWESDVTARAAVEQSVATNVAEVGTGALMVGGQASVEGAFREALSRYGFNLHGNYERVFQVALETGQFSPSDSASAQLEGGAGYTLSRGTELTLGARGYLATRLGTRATDALAVRDPFLFGNRLQYTLATSPSVSFTGFRRTTVRVGVTYGQAGAVSADDPQAVGVDAHTGKGDLSLTYDIGALDSLSPEVRYELDHYYHALLDTDLHRGEVDTHAVSALLSESHEFSRNLVGRVSAGATVASAPPIVVSNDVVVAPNARAVLNYVGQRYRVNASYAYEYTSLGPRIGFGYQHEAAVGVDFRPIRGRAYRDLVISGFGRFSAGSAPVAASPPLHVDLSTPRPSAEGTLSTTLAVAGVQVEVPIAGGLLLRGGVDLEYLRAVLDPAPSTAVAEPTLRSIFTAAIAGTLSTDKHATVRRDPGTAWDSERREALNKGMSSGQWQAPAQVTEPGYETDDQMANGDRIRAEDELRRIERDEAASAPPPGSSSEAIPAGSEPSYPPDTP